MAEYDYEEMDENEDVQDSGLTDEQVESITATLIRDAIDYIDNEVSKDRSDATRYYHGEQFGDEEEGRSRVVSRDVRDTVQNIMPSLMRIFTGTDKAVEFEARGPEDEAAAQQATDYVDYIINNDNRGFQVHYDVFKDALIRKTGVYKVWWDELIDKKSYEFTGLSGEQVQLLAADPDHEIIEIEEYIEDGMPPTFEVSLNRVTRDGRVRVEAVPPEEFLIDRDARSEEDASIVAHRRIVTKGELVSMGYSMEDLEDLGSPDGDDELDYNQEVQARNPLQSYPKDEPYTDPSRQKVLYIEAYVRLDVDGDGISELHKVCCVGNAYKVLHQEPCDHIPFATLCPDPEPHTFFGTSIAELVMDIQRIKSQVMRGMLDSLAQSIHPRTAVVEGQANIDDVLNNEVGAIIRMRAPGMVQPFSQPFVGQQAFPMVDYMDKVKETRTGISKAAAGMDAESLQSTTKVAVDATIKAAQSQIELIARIFSETGIRRLYRLILRLITQNQDAERVVRLRNQWIPIDPRSWDAEMDVRTNVILGAGSDEEKFQRMSLVVGKQEQILQTLGADNPLVSIQQLRNSYVKMLELAGFKNPDQYFMDPSKQPPKPPSQPKPDPAMMLAQAELQKAQAEVMKIQTETQLKVDELRRKDDLERDKLEADIAIKSAELQSRYGAAIDQAQIRADMERDREAMRVVSQPQNGVQ